MNRRGVALMAVIWLLALLSVLAATALLDARTFLQAVTNRLANRSAEWAAASCVSWARSRSDWTRPYRMDSIAVSERLWCTIESAPTGVAMNVNLASRQMLLAYLGSEDLASALLDWRDADSSQREHGAEQDWYRAAGRVGPRDGPLAAVEEVALIRGFERFTAAEVQQRFAVGSDGRVNVRFASAEILAATGSFPLEALALDELHPRPAGRSIASLEELAARLPVGRRRLLERDWALLLRQLDFGSERRAIRVVGRVRGTNNK